MIAETHLSTGAKLAILIPVVIMAIIVLCFLFWMTWQDRPSKPSAEEKRLRDVEANIERLVSEFGRKGIIAFMTRGQLEDRAVKKQEGCPACGHKDG